jgi:hypothetical protein
MKIAFSSWGPVALQRSGREVVASIQPLARIMHEGIKSEGLLC